MRTRTTLSKTQSSPQSSSSPFQILSSQNALIQQQQSLRARATQRTLNAATSLVWKNFGANSVEFSAQFESYRALSALMHSILGDVRFCLS
jgi:hypothetical protein